MSETQTNNETKHTPGEWKPYFVRWTPESPIQGFAVRVKGKRRSIAGAGYAEPDVVLVLDEHVQSQPWAKEFYTSEEVEANARLIAAAPDLLAVLAEADEYLSGNEQNYIGSGSVLHQKMRDAINKALGAE